MSTQRSVSFKELSKHQLDNEMLISTLKTEMMKTFKCQPEFKLTTENVKVCWLIINTINVACFIINLAFHYYIDIYVNHLIWFSYTNLKEIYPDLILLSTLWFKIHMLKWQLCTFTYNLHHISINPFLFICVAVVPMKGTRLFGFVYFCGT